MIIFEVTARVAGLVLVVVGVVLAVLAVLVAIAVDAAEPSCLVLVLVRPHPRHDSSSSSCKWPNCEHGVPSCNMKCRPRWPALSVLSSTA